MLSHFSMFASSTVFPLALFIILLYFLAAAETSMPYILFTLFSFIMQDFLGLILISAHY